MSLSIQVPTVGQANSTEAVKVSNSLTNLSSWANGNIPGSDLSASANIAGTQLAAAANIAGTQLAAAAAIADTQLASPNNGVGRVLLMAPFYITALTTTPSWFVNNNVILSGSSAALASPIYMGDEASDWAVAGKSTVAKVRATLAASSINPAITFTFGLYPVTAAAGTGGGVSLTLGTVVAGSTVALTPSAGAAATGVSSQFSLPSSAGISYVPGVVGSGTQTVNSALIGRVSLRVYNV